MIKVRCPICQRPMAGQSSAEWPQFPFCSPKCRLIDLGRWLGEDYRIASDHPEEETKETEILDEPP
jgi:endogenous inhibitor of DNA gyrase (YacG/DUF329 family)